MMLATIIGRMFVGMCMDSSIVPNATIMRQSKLTNKHYELIPEIFKFLKI